jgi:hypothetical protein
MELGSKRRKARSVRVTPVLENLPPPVTHVPVATRTPTVSPEGRPDTTMSAALAEIVAESRKSALAAGAAAQKPRDGETFRKSEKTVTVPPF